MSDPTPIKPPTSRDLLAEVAYADPYRLYKGAHITPYNPSDLIGKKGYRVIDRMRKDEQVKIAMSFKKHAVLASGWHVKSPEGRSDDWEPRVRIEEMLNDVACGMDEAIKGLLTSLDYGFSVSEKIFAERGGLIWITDIKSRKPHRMEFYQDQFGNLIELKQQTQDGIINIPREKVIVLTNEYEFGNIYGTSDLEAAYRAFWSKENAYKWLSMLLEKFGIPPVYVQYNYNRYGADQLTALKNVLTSMQANTVGLIPRLEEKDITLWSPSLADNVGTVFIPALEKYDKDIARAILIPGLLGLTPEEAVGSQARSETVFDGFLMTIEQLRGQVEDAVNEDVVRQLVALNWGGDEFPAFEFLPIKQDDRIGLMEIWTKLIDSGAVVSGIEDEDHVRSIMGFPKADENAPRPGDEPPVEGEDEEEESDLTQIAVDYAQVETRLNGIESDFMDTASAIIEKRVTRLASGLDGLLAIEGVAGMRLRMRLIDPVTAMVDAAYEAGSADLRRETQGVRLAEFPRVRPADAVKYLRQKALMLAATINDEILRDIQRVLVSALETGSTTQDMVAALFKVMEPWIGSDQLRDGEAVKRHRLEAVARTETTNSYNTGRLIQARAPKLSKFLQGLRYDAILDTRTTEVCRHLDGKIFRIGDSDLDRLSPPNHVNCRSILTPVSISQDVEESEYATPSDVGKALELAGSGFAGPKSL